MLKITPVAAFEDNYIWLLQRGFHAVVVDPGDAAPVIEALQALSLKLDAILLTHHHADHIGGVEQLLNLWPAIVYAPEARNPNAGRSGHYAFPHMQMHENDAIHLDGIDVDFTVMEVPGHTLDHIAYYGANSLFCGDTLFSAGCGRLFEGTPAQMHASLQRLAQLPASTQVYCAHEYTEHNLQFALKLDPDNRELMLRQQQVRRLRQQFQPSLPTSIQTELATNPFLRCHTAEVKRMSGIPDGDPIAVFAAIRELRNHF